MTRKATAAPRNPSTAASANVAAPKRATPADLDRARFEQLLDERIHSAREKISGVVAEIGRAHV